MKVLFIHRSVGHNLLHDGNVRELLKNYPDIQFDDYDQNMDQLTTVDGRQKQCGFTFPGGDTKPAAYANIFSGHATGKSGAIRDFALSYDKIIIKSCYPNSNIRSEEELATIKGYYTSITNYFANRPDKLLVIVTSPPLAPFRTTKSNAERAQQLAGWLANQGFGKNVNVFDFYSLLADKHGVLKRAYRRWLPVDSHPSKRASVDIAPEFVKAML